MASLPQVSIVIPTFNRIEALMEALGAIRRQSLGDFEAIVVDNGPSTDGTGEQVQNFIQADGRFFYISTNEKGDFLARNMGCRMARADIIITTDDDWEMTDSDTLSYAVSCFKDDEKLAVLGLSEYYPDGKAKGKTVSCAVPRSWYYMLKDTTLYHPGRINKWGMIGSKFYYLPMGRKYIADHVRSSCMAFRKDIAGQFGYFPTFYVLNGDGYRSETELCCDFRRKGYKVIFSSEIQGLHKLFTRDASVTGRTPAPDFLYRTGRNNTLFFLRNYWSSFTSPVFFIWDLLVGNSTQPGVIRFFTSQKHMKSRANIQASIAGKWRGFIEYQVRYHNLRNII